MRAGCRTVASLAAGFALCSLWACAPGRPYTDSLLSAGGGPAPGGAPRSVGRATSRASTAAPSQQRAAQQHDRATVQEPDSLSEIVGQIKTLQLEPEAEARLIADLKQTDPAVWPQLVATLRATLAYQQKSKDKKQLAATEADEGPEDHDHRFRARTKTSDTTWTEVADEKARPGPQAVSPPTAPADLKQASSEARPNLIAAGQTAGHEGALDIGGKTTVAGGSVQVTDMAPSAAASDNARQTVPTGQESAPVRPAKFEQAVPPDRPVDWRSQLSALILDLESQLKAEEGSSRVEGEIQLRLLYALAGRREEALRPIQGLPPAKQDFWAKELFGLTSLLNSGGQAEAESRAAEAALHLADATARLRDSAALVVRNLAFCTEVTSYGVYKPFDNYVFHPEQEVLLYAEVENFKSEVVPEGYKTVLSSRYQLFDREGKQVEERDFGVTEEVCRNRRRDFFIRYQFALPSRIYDGTYTLKLTVEDTKGEKVGQSSIDFAIKQTRRP